MLDYDSNYDNIICPYCKIKVVTYKGYNDNIIDLKDEEIDFFQCPECLNYFKIELEVYKEYDYIVSKPTKEEIKEYEFLISINHEDMILTDCPGQMFIWNNLFPNKC